MVEVLVGNAVVVVVVAGFVPSELHTKLLLGQQAVLVLLAGVIVFPVQAVHPPASVT